MKTQVLSYNYNREHIKPGILHIGVGNFHRAHEEFYTNLLLEDPTQQDWGICGAMLLPGDERLYRILEKQKKEYTLTICGRDGKDQTYQIGSLIELIWGIENPAAIINKIADKNIHIITLTITEGGYNIAKATNEFMLDNENIKYDLAHPQSPKTTFGFVAEGLRKRKAVGNGPITILSCDNLQHNGNTARKAFLSFFQAQDPELAEWATVNITFPNSMVDRITPSTQPEDIIRLNTQNVTTYENMKLSLLNASHTLLSYPAFLSGYRKVDVAISDERIKKFVRGFMDIDITPYVPAPGNMDLDLYKQTLIERFGNHTVSDQVARLCFDGASKFPVYIMPNLIQMIRDRANLTRQAYLFAAYRHYLKYKTDDNGTKFEIAEPWLTATDDILIASNSPIDFLSLSPFQSTELKAADEFVELYLQMVNAIKEKGTMSTLESIL